MATRLFPPGSDDVIYIVDLSSYVLRAYHAVAPLQSPNGEPTGAIHGMVNMLELMLRERNPRLLAVALDAGRETFRREIYPEYKANRPPSPDDLRSQLSRCEQIVHRWKLSVSRMRAQAIVRAVAHYADPKALLDASRATDTGMRGIAAAGLPAGEQLAPRGW